MNMIPKTDFPSNGAHCWIFYNGAWVIARFQQNVYTGHACFILIEDKGGFPIIDLSLLSGWIEIEMPLTQCMVGRDTECGADVDDKPLTQCMVGRDTECNHPKCPVTDEDAKAGRYCTLPLYDWRE